MNVEKRNPKIFLLGGKAGSGKDTVCNIIEKHYESKGLNIINLQFSTYIKEYAKNVSNWDGSDNSKPRKLLQTIGTDIIRNNIDKYFFINRLINDIEVYSYFFDIITISDGRFTEEFEKVASVHPDVIKINVLRPSFDNGLSIDEKNHATETGLDFYNKFDLVIENVGTIDELKGKVTKIIEVIK